MAKITRHAFLTPGHNCWIFWTHTGSVNITNPGESHRTMEVLAYAIDKLIADGWELLQVFSDSGTPNLALLERTEETAE